MSALSFVDSDTYRIVDEDHSISDVSDIEMSDDPNYGGKEEVNTAMILDAVHNLSTGRCGKNTDHCFTNKLVLAEQQSESHKPRAPSSRNIVFKDPNEHYNKKAFWIPCGSPSRNTGLSKLQTVRQRRNSNSESGKTVTPRNIVGELVKTEKKPSIASFKRSLKLLGLPTDDILSNKNNADSKSLQYTRAAPTMCTRVLKRSVSLTSLRGALQEVSSEKSLEYVDRETISKAVYEEWYFRKMEEARRKKEKEAEEEKKRQESLQQAREEKMRLAKENFEKWMNSKTNSKTPKRAEKRDPLFRTSKYMALHVTPDQARDAYHAWVKEKEKFLREKVKQKQEQKEKETEKERSEREKRESAKQAFELWKQRIDEDLKARQQEKERLSKEAEEKRKEKMLEKIRDAGSSFEAWKRQKDEELKIKLRKERLEQEQKVRDAEIQSERRVYEAQQAFYEWLDQVEERLDTEREASLIRIGLKLTAVPQTPWSPGGVVTH